MNKQVVNILIPIWLASYAAFSYAASITLAQQMRGYDFESLLWSLAAGLFGGVLRSIITLAGKKRWILDVVKETVKDLIVAMVAGLFVYIVLIGISAGMETYFSMSPIPSNAQVLILVLAGWAPKMFFRGVDKAAASAIDRIDDTIRNFRKKPNEVETQPASIAAPLKQENP